MKYLIVIEKACRGYSAYSPDLPGCVAAGATRVQIERAMRKAIAMHLEELRAEGEKLPTPHASSSYVEVSA
jgi:predicted RNase H-like HicB family nuclease